MAVLPRGGRRIRPAGPAGVWPSNRIYDLGLAAWSDSLGNMSQTLLAKDAEIKKAHETTELLGRTSEYSLQLNNLLEQTKGLTIEGRPASADEQERYFRTESQKLSSQFLDWKGVSLVTRTRLENAMTAEMTQQVGNLRDIQRTRRMQDIRDRSNAAVEIATRTGNEILHTEALDELVNTNIITPAKRDQLKAEFPVNAKLADSYIKVNTDPETALKNLKTILADTTITEDQRDRANRLAGMAESIMKDRKAQVKFLSDQQKRAMVMDLLGRIDSNDQTVGQAITQADVLSLPGDSKEVSQAKLSTWLGNRTRELNTEYGKGLHIVGEAIAAIGADDQYEFRTKLADARYGDNGYLSQGDYERIKGLLTKGYRKDEGASLQAAWKSIQRSRPAWLEVSEVGATPETGLSLAPADRLSMFGQFMAWFDEQKAKGKSPDPEESVVFARKLTALGPLLPKQQPEIPPDLLEGLDDQQRDWAVRQIRAIGVEEFRRKYAQPE